MIFSSYWLDIPTHRRTKLNYKDEEGEKIWNKGEERFSEKEEKEEKESYFAVEEVLDEGVQ